MPNQLDLLKMLEPAVRPLGTPAPNNIRQHAPIEQVNFADIFRQIDASATDSRSANPSDDPAVDGQFASDIHEELQQMGIALNMGMHAHRPMPPIGNPVQQTADQQEEIAPPQVAPAQLLEGLNHINNVSVMQTLAAHGRQTTAGSTSGGTANGE